MRIIDYIRHKIIGKDTTLTMFDLAMVFYDTKFPTMAQRVAINRAIAMVADGVEIIALKINDKGHKLLYNPHSDKSVCLASGKLKNARTGAFSSDEVVWNRLLFEKNGQSFDKLKSGVKTQALIARAIKAGNSGLAEQIRNDTRPRSDNRNAEPNASFPGKPAAPAVPTKVDVKQALMTLYQYALATDEHGGVQGEHEGKLLKFTIEDK